MKSQNDIFQQIADMVFKVIEPRWIECTINYKVDDNRSKEINTYLVNENGTLKEKSLTFLPNLNQILRELRDNIAQDKEPFTGCIIQLKSSGEFNADYSYDPVNWKLSGSWNYNINT